MDYGMLISESIDYTRDALAGRPSTWLVFILCGLPAALIPFVFNPEKIIDAETAAIHWELIPWPQFLALLAAGFLLSFIISGYLVRVYRGTTPPPAFDQPGPMYLDGIKVMIVGILWFVPAVVTGLAAAGLFILGIASSEAAGSYLIAALLLILAAVVLIIITCLFSMLGSVRFARTGSIREGIRFSAILETIRVIGWGTYILAVVILLVLGIVFSLVAGALSAVPFVGWVIELAVTPLLSVFCARYISRVYDHGVPEGTTAPQGPAP